MGRRDSFVAYDSTHKQYRNTTLRQDTSRRFAVVLGINGESAINNYVAHVSLNRLGFELATSRLAGRNVSAVGPYQPL